MGFFQALAAPGRRLGSHPVSGAIQTGGNTGPGSGNPAFPARISFLFPVNCLSCNSGDIQRFAEGKRECRVGACGRPGPEGRLCVARGFTQLPTPSAGCVFFCGAVGGKRCVEKQGFLSGERIGVGAAGWPKRLLTPALAALASLANATNSGIGSGGEGSTAQGDSARAAPGGLGAGIAARRVFGGGAGGMAGCRPVVRRV